MTDEERKTEKELQELLLLSEADIKDTQKKIIILRKELETEQDNLIKYSLHRDMFKERLRVFHAREVKVEITQRDIDIDDFRVRFPELCKKPE
jgi:hypothetical protein